MIVAVDTGGTKTLVAAFDTSGQIVAEYKFPTPPDVNDYIPRLKTVIDELTSGNPLTCISVGLPGTIVKGRMIWGGNLDWRGTDMKALLSDHYECPIIVENDANLAGLAEARALGETPHICLYVTISTGIGTGLIVDGKIDQNFSTSEGGQIVLEYDGALQRWELFASGKAVHTRTGKYASEITEEATWDTIANDIAKGLMVHCPILRPEIVVIGGGMGAYLERFIDPLMKILRENMIELHVPSITRAVHPDESVIYGAYYHALDTIPA